MVGGLRGGENVFDGRTLYFVGCEKVRNEWVDGGGGAVGRGDSHRWDGLDRCTAACFGEVNVSQRPSSRGVSVEAHANHTARLHRYPGPITGQRDKAPLLYTKGRCPVLPTPPPVHASTFTPSPSSTTHHTHQSPCTIPIPASNAKSIHLTSPPPRRKHPDRAPGTRHSVSCIALTCVHTYLGTYLSLSTDALSRRAGQRSHTTTCYAASRYHSGATPTGAPQSLRGSGCARGSAEGVA